MGQLKNYLLTVLERCSEEEFGQRAVEWAIVCGHIKLTYNLDTDLRAIMGEAAHPSHPSHPSPGCYDAICAGYRNHCRQNTELLVDSYAPLLAQIQATGTS